MKWTEEDIAQVFAMVGAGTSMAVIAQHLGCSRNAVIGLYRRERLKRGTLPPVTPRKRILVPETRRDPNPYRDTVDKGGGGRLRAEVACEQAYACLGMTSVLVLSKGSGAVGLGDVAASSGPPNLMPMLPTEGLGFVLPPMDSAPEPAPEARARPAIGILDVTGCRWPVDADPAIIGRHAFCNAECQEGQSYCPEHRRENKAAYSRTLINKTTRSAIKTLARRRAA